MEYKARCSKAKPNKMNTVLYCEGKFICGKQYACKATHRYENTPDYKNCNHLKTGNQLETREKPTQASRYLQNVIPSGKIVEQPEAQEQADETQTNETNESEGSEKYNGQVRKHHSRGRKES